MSRVLVKQALSLRERVAEGRVRAGKLHILRNGPHPAASRLALSRRERAAGKQ